MIKLKTMNGMNALTQKMSLSLLECISLAHSIWFLSDCEGFLEHCGVVGRVVDD